ncbi:isocitrate dehydrogenase [Halomonas elongata]|uniref:Isocitrate dehydrogenase n=1 Tax=Halomonas elongata TaxID=2746 RepID=A0A1B8NV36_HALEL|nr:hypothetical protein [Halomonas elongata]OBX33876.1 isocitrate dehydrogenase [Halomonas elongata]
MGNALETLAERENNAELGDYATRLKAALIDTIGDGIVTGDLKGKTTEPDKETVVDMQGFLDAVAQRLTA